MTERENGSSPEGRNVPPWLKAATEFGPLVVFFGVYYLTDLITATGALMVTTVIALGVRYALEGRIPLLPLISGIILMLFGGLTLILNDPRFVMMKPTIYYSACALVLLSGLAFNKLFLKMLLDSTIRIEERGWRIFTYRWIAFFIFQAILNEIVWRSFSEATWVWFKVAGALPLTALFMFAQVPLFMKYELKDGENGKESSNGAG